MLGDAERQLHQIERPQRQGCVDGRKRLPVKRFDPPVEAFLQRALGIDHHGNHVGGKVACPCAGQPIQQGSRPGDCRAVIRMGRALQHCQKVAAVPVANLRGFGVDPGEAAVDQLGIGGHGHMMLADQIGLKLRDAIVWFAVHADQVADDGIDRDPQFALVAVEPIRRQQSLSGRLGIGPLDNGRLRDTAGDVAFTIVLQSAEEIFPMGALQAKHALQQPVYPDAVRFRSHRGKPEQGLHLHRKRAGVVAVAFDPP
jgi:hypothetical protein